MTYTVQELFDNVGDHAGSAGTCDEATFMKQMNTAGPMILKRVDTEGMMWTWCLGICGHCVILPFTVRSVRQAFVGCDPVELKSEWWQGRLSGDLGSDALQEYPWQNLVDTGRRSATQRPTNAQTNERFEIKTYKTEDKGLEFSLIFVDSHGNAKTWKDKFKPDGQPVFSEIGIGEVLRFEKPRTKGKVELWANHKVTGVRRLLSVYGPSDEVPEYKVFQLTGWKTGRLIIRGKREWVPVRSMDDIIWFGDYEAWGTALRAESAWRNGNEPEKEALLQNAVAALTLDLQDRRPHAQSQTVQIVTPWTGKNKWQPNTNPAPLTRFNPFYG